MPSEGGERLSKVEWEVYDTFTVRRRLLMRLLPEELVNPGSLTINFHGSTPTKTLASDLRCCWVCAAQ